MIIERLVETTETHNIAVTDISLLSKEEYETYRNIIPFIQKYWWLCSPCNDPRHSMIVDYEGDIQTDGNLCSLSHRGVRPVLHLSNTDNLQAGDIFRLASCEWTVLDENLAICNDTIGKHCFRQDDVEDANDFQKSDIKNYLESWAEEQRIFRRHYSRFIHIFVKSADMLRRNHVHKIRVERLIRTTDIQIIKISEISLLSADIFNKVKSIIPPLYTYWWLLTPSNDCSCEVVSVSRWKTPDISNVKGVIGVRPVLRISNLQTLNIHVGNNFKMADHTWTVITDDMALCNDTIGRHCFRTDANAENANIYEFSDIKLFIDKWAKENIVL